MELLQARNAVVGPSHKISAATGRQASWNSIAWPAFGAERYSEVSVGKPGTGTASSMAMR
jgi:hypothetical protein